MGKTARQNKQEFINPTESEQDSDTQIHKPSFRLISSLENTAPATPDAIRTNKGPARVVNRRIVRGTLDRVRSNGRGCA